MISFQAVMHSVCHICINDDDYPQKLRIHLISDVNKDWTCKDKDKDFPRFATTHTD